MKLSYALTIEDYAGFNRFFYAGRLKRSYRLIAVVFVMLVFVNFYSLIVNGTFRAEDLWSPSIFICVFYLGFLLVFRSKWFLEFRCRRLIYSGKNAGLLDERTLTFDEKELNVVTEFYDFKYKWSGFENLKESKKHLFLFISVNQAIIIPKRIFLLAQEEHDVKSFIERKLSEQKNQDYE